MTSAVAARHRVGGALLAAVAAALYLETLRSPFQYDDWVTVAEQPALVALGAAPPPPSDGADFRPVTTLTYRADAAWGRLVGPPGASPVWPYHLTNLVLHVLAVLLAAWLARLWWEDGLAAALAGLIVAVHPFNAEAVNYISARSSLVAACAELAAVGMYTVWVRSARPAALWGALAAAVLALGAKESALTLPGLFVLVDRLFIHPGDSWTACARRAWPWWGLAAAAAILRGWLPDDLSTGMTYSTGDGGAAALTSLGVVWLAMRDWWWPINLTVEHGVELLSPAAMGAALAATAAALAITVASWRRWTRTRRVISALPFFAVWWWVIAALPGMILPYVTHVALYQENRFYLAGFGLAWTMGLLGARGWRSATSRRALMGVLTAVTVTVLAVLTHARNDVWKSETALWSDAVAKAPRSALAHNMLGAAHLAAQRPERAIAPLERAVQLDPSYPRAANNLGAAYAMQGRWPQAIHQFQRTLALDAGFAQARKNLAEAYERTGRTREALAEYRTLVGQVDDDDLWLRLGGAALGVGDWNAAEDAFATLVRRRPDSAPALFNLGLVAEGRGHWDAAASRYRQALAADPADPDVHYKLGFLAARDGRSNEARASLETALRLAPDHVLARVELGVLEEAQGRINDALEQYRRALDAMGQEPRWGPARQFAQERLQRHSGGPSGAPSRGR